MKQKENRQRVLELSKARAYSLGETLSLLVISHFLAISHPTLLHFNFIVSHLNYYLFFLLSFFFSFTPNFHTHNYLSFFFSFTTFHCLIIGLASLKYNQSLCEFETWTFILIFITCDKIDTLSNKLTATKSYYFLNLG